MRYSLLVSGGAPIVKATNRLKELFSRKGVKRKIPPVPKGRKVLLPDEDGVEEQIVTALEAIGTDTKLGYADGQSFMIEYVDSEGQPSTRRIAVWGIQRGAQSVPILAALCHERQAARSFRTDRVKAVIDYDGTVHEPPTSFFADVFGMPMDAASRTQYSPTVSEDEIVFRGQIRSLVRQEAVLLAGVSHSDGGMIPSEISVIVNYLAGRCANAGLPLGQTERNWLYDYVKRLLPDETTIELVFEEALDPQPGEAEELISACWAIIQADGNIDDAEVQLLNEICVELTGHSIN